jgi:hypothetical protein
MGKLKRVAGRSAAAITGLATSLALEVDSAFAAGGGGSGVNITPNTTGLPGLTQGETIVGSFITVAVICSVLGLALSAIVWSVGNHSANPQVAGRGKSGVLVSAASAILSGGAMAIVNFFYGIGAGI